MAFNGYLTNQQIDELTKAALQSGLLAVPRQTLLAGIPPGFAAALPVASSPLDQFVLDLVQVNRVQRMVGGEVPLLTLLENAAARLQLLDRAEARVFDRILSLARNVAAGMPPMPEPAQLPEANLAIPGARPGGEVSQSSTDLRHSAETDKDDMLRADALEGTGVQIGEGSQIIYAYNRTWTEDVAPLPGHGPDPSATNRHYRIFLCHSSGDKRRVRKLYGRLREKGFDPWLDEKNIVAGQDWDAEIRKAVHTADLVIVCLSQASVAKTGYVQREIRMVLDLADEQPEGKIFIIPAKLEVCEVPDRLMRWQWVELYRSGGYERLFAALARASSTSSG